MDAPYSAYLQLLFSTILLTGAELLLKLGASQDGTGAEQLMNFAALSSLATWLGILLYVLSFVSWLIVLRTMPVGPAYAIASVIQLLVPIGASLFLNERIAADRALGIVLVFAGMLLAAAPSASAERRL